MSKWKQLRNALTIIIFCLAFSNVKLSNIYLMDQGKNILRIP